MTEIMEVKRDNTGEVADDDGDASDGGETEVIEGVEVADHRGEWWVSIYNWVLWLLRGCDVCVHSVAAACVNRWLLLVVVPCQFQVSTPEWEFRYGLSLGFSHWVIIWASCDWCRFCDIIELLHTLRAFRLEIKLQTNSTC